MKRAALAVVPALVDSSRMTASVEDAGAGVATPAPAAVVGSK
jgi:hypothetical protein